LATTTVSAGGKLFIPAVDDSLRLGARGAIGDLPFGLEANVEPARPVPMAAVRPLFRVHAESPSRSPIASDRYAGIRLFCENFGRIKSTRRFWRS
jgi:hypothetical protein